MWDMRNVAAEKTKPLRLDPDPARACPAPIRRRATRGRRQRATIQGCHESVNRAVAEFLGEEPVLPLLANAHVQPQARETAKGSCAPRLAASPASASKSNKSAKTGLTPIVRNSEMRHRRWKLPEAMREVGLDEPALAEILMEIHARRRVSNPADAAKIANDKFLLEFVKDCARMLEAPKSAGDDAAGEAPTVLRLLHNVPRPDREHAQ
jgi:hypothetical protein